jgi:hypothetical protein
LIVGCLAHHAMGVGTDILHADIVTQNYENIQFVLLCFHHTPTYGRVNVLGKIF